VELRGALVLVELRVLVERVLDRRSPPYSEVVEARVKSESRRRREETGGDLQGELDPVIDMACACRASARRPSPHDRARAAWRPALHLRVVARQGVGRTFSPSAAILPWRPSARPEPGRYSSGVVTPGSTSKNLPPLGRRRSRRSRRRPRELASGTRSRSRPSARPPLSRSTRNPRS